MILLLDNYDSFTYNLLHYLSELGSTVEAVRNDAMTADAFLKTKNLKGIVISPGPGTPEESGICLDVIKKNAGKIPLFGVCLGHQAIGQAYGGKVIRAPKPMHGKVSAVTDTGKGVFTGLPNPFNATRYHSLIVERDSLPARLEITAEADGLIMGLQHKELPIHGVQFHPESIASEHGHDLLRNFVKLI